MLRQVLTSSELAELGLDGATDDLPVPCEALKFDDFLQIRTLTIIKFIVFWLTIYACCAQYLYDSSVSPSPTVFLSYGIITLVFLICEVAVGLHLTKGSCTGWDLCGALGGVLSQLGTFCDFTFSILAIKIGYNTTGILSLIFCLLASGAVVGVQQIRMMFALCSAFDTYTVEKVEAFFDIEMLRVCQTPPLAVSSSPAISSSVVSPPLAVSSSSAVSLSSAAEASTSTTAATSLTSAAVLFATGATTAELTVPTTGITLTRESAPADAMSSYRDSDIVPQLDVINLSANISMSNGCNNLERLTFNSNPSSSFLPILFKIICIYFFNLLAWFRSLLSSLQFSNCCSGADNSVGGRTTSSISTLANPYAKKSKENKPHLTQLWSSSRSKLADSDSWSNLEMSAYSLREGYEFSELNNKDCHHHEGYTISPVGAAANLECFCRRQDIMTPQTQVMYPQDTVLLSKKRKASLSEFPLVSQIAKKSIKIAAKCTSGNNDEMLYIDNAQPKRVSEKNRNISPLVTSLSKASTMQSIFSSYAPFGADQRIWDNNLLPKDKIVGLIIKNTTNQGELLMNPYVLPPPAGHPSIYTPSYYFMLQMLNLTTLGPKLFTLIARVFSTMSSCVHRCCRHCPFASLPSSCYLSPSESSSSRNLSLLASPYLVTAPELQFNNTECLQTFSRTTPAIADCDVSELETSAVNPENSVERVQKFQDSFQDLSGENLYQNNHNSQQQQLFDMEELRQLWMWNYSNFQSIVEVDLNKIIQICNTTQLLDCMYLQNVLRRKYLPMDSLEVHEFASALNTAGRCFIQDLLLFLFKVYLLVSFKFDFFILFTLVLGFIKSVYLCFYNTLDEDLWQDLFTSD